MTPNLCPTPSFTRFNVFFIANTMPQPGPDWFYALAASDLPNDDVLGVMVEDKDIAICTVGEAIYAIDNVCSHGNARLCNGFLDGHEIECPLHQGKFDVRDGKPLCDPVTEPVRSYPVKISEGHVWVQFANP
jgi:naphthalene 1,2-dioxygenase ferredoxin component